MRVELATRSTGVGYFPGLAKPVVLDDRELPTDQAEQLHRLVAEAGFFLLPAQIGKPSPGAADYRTYTVTVEHGTKRHSVSVSDPIESAGLRSLLDFVRARAKPRD